LQRELPFAVAAEPHDRDVERRRLAVAARAGDARVEPGGGCVGAAADVTADDAQPGPHRADHPLADAGDGERGGRRRGQRHADDEQDGDVLDGRLATAGSGHTPL
jgi:hypothetical protein